MIRPITICLFQNDGRILVTPINTSGGVLLGYRPLGGGIEFGELGVDCIKREMMEELSAEITNLNFLYIIENIFTYEGEPKHEIVFVYDAQFRDKTLYAKDKLEGYEQEVDDYFKAMWMPVSYFIENPHMPLFPNHLLEHIIADNPHLETE